MSVASIQTVLLLRDPSQSTESRLADLIAQAMLQLDAATFGDKYDMACALLVLHWLAKEESAAGAAGAVISEKEGDLRRQYASPPLGIGTIDLDSTQWGRELNLMIKSYTLPFLNAMFGEI